MSVSDVVDVLRELSRAIQRQVLAACRDQSIEQLSAVSLEAREDTIFNIDRVSESALLAGIAPHAVRLGGVVLVAEGLSSEEVTLPEAWRPEQARWRVIVDPIDGTRGLMVQKRSAWILAAVAPNDARPARLGDLEAAIQTEIPTLKAAVADELWALKGEPPGALRRSIDGGASVPLVLRPSRAGSIRHGYAMLSRFFPGARDELAAIDDEVCRRVLGPNLTGKALCFEDQYLSTGGQLYELAMGHDRFVADLRPLMAPLLRQRGTPLGLCCHPYDICTALIAQQAGVIVTAPDGGPLDAPLDVHSDVAWVAYANAAIRREVEPALQATLRERGWLA
ncbi:MAG TPA: hypothetical protein VFU02_23455 [Polyangiaceae bacterium]|nr:hypothetical protein [Polyangiaceae bacterium]